MNEEDDSKADGFLSAPQLLKTKGIGNVAWEDWQQSEIALPKTGKKYFEPSGTWLQQMQLENGLKNRKRLIEIERVERASQLALAEWLPGSQKAKVTKKSGQKWDSFGYEEKSQLYLLPEEALILLEMNCLELTWNGMPLSIQHAYEVLINSQNSKCTLDEYRVYSQLVRRGYKLQRFCDKLSYDNKSSNTTRRIIMNPDGLWTPNTSPTNDKQVSNNSISPLTVSNKQEDNNITTESEKFENGKSSKAQKLGIVSEETVLCNIKIIKNNTSLKDSSDKNQVSKWPGSRIQRNVKLMPKRNDLNNLSNNLINDCTNVSPNKLSNFNSEPIDQNATNPVSEKRKNNDVAEFSVIKKPRPEVIELSDDEIEEIPRPMTRLEILNTLPNLAGIDNEPIIAKIQRTYIPHTVKPIKDVYHFDRQRLLNLSQSDNILKSNRQLVPVNNIHNRQASDFYSQGSQCQSITTYNSNNGYSYRGIRCQRDGNSYIQQNVSHNTIHSPYSGTILQSNCVDFMMEVMGNMVRSFRQQQFQQTTFCQNLQIFSPRFPFSQQRFQQSYNVNYFTSSPNQYYRRGGGGFSYAPHRGRGGGYRYGSCENQRISVQDEIYQPAFIKRAGVNSWSELKKKWREESTITIEDEEPVQQDTNEVQVVKESINPIINMKISNMTDVYEKLRIIKSAPERTVRLRKVDYSLSYNVYPANQRYRKSSPGTPMCRLFIVNSKKESCLDISKLHRLQQESKDIPVVVAFVSPSCISYVQPGVVLLPNLS